MPQRLDGRPTFGVQFTAGCFLFQQLRLEVPDKEQLLTPWWLRLAEVKVIAFLALFFNQADHNQK
jgi:hypothetical protein